MDCGLGRWAEGPAALRRGLGQGSVEGRLKPRGRCSSLRKLPWKRRAVAEDRALGSASLKGERRRRSVWWRQRRNRVVDGLPGRGAMEIEGSFSRSDGPSAVPDASENSVRTEMDAWHLAIQGSLVT